MFKFLDYIIDVFLQFFSAFIINIVVRSLVIFFMFLYLLIFVYSIIFFEYCSALYFNLSVYFLGRNKEVFADDYPVLINIIFCSVVLLFMIVLTSFAFIGLSINEVFNLICSCFFVINNSFIVFFDYLHFGKVENCEHIDTFSKIDGVKYTYLQFFIDYRSRYTRFSENNEVLENCDYFCKIMSVHSIWHYPQEFKEDYDQEVDDRMPCVASDSGFCYSN